MSLYNLVFGDRSAAYGAIPALLGDDLDVGRYRDCWFESDGEGADSVVLAVYTRNGGGNREEYASAIADMEDHPFFVSDADDEFDSTYATFRFRIPRSKLVEATNEPTADSVLEQAGPVVDPSARWLTAIAAIENQKKEA